MKTIIFDLDGTLADISKRKKLATLKNGKLNWNELFNPINIKLDKPIPEIIDIYKSLESSGFRIGIMSGRSYRTIDATEQWLSKHDIKYDFIYMRPVNDFTPDTKLKKSWVEEEQRKGHEILCAFDDRDKVVKMFREMGIKCLQVTEGNF